MGFFKKLTGKFTGLVQLGRGNDDLRDSGVKGRAEIVSAEPTGRTIGTTDTGGYTQDAQDIMRVRARVTIPGREPHDVDHETTQQPTAGSSVDCWVDPDDAQRVHYDEAGVMPGMTEEQTKQVQDAVEQANKFFAQYQQGNQPPPSPPPS